MGVEAAGDPSPPGGEGGGGGPTGEVGQHQHWGEGVPETNLSQLAGPQVMVYGIVLGVGVGILAIVATVLATVVRRWRGAKALPPPIDFDLDLERPQELETSRSAPVTRSPSPRVEKKKWFFAREDKKAPLVRSLTADLISQLQLPAEHVQPPAQESKGPSTSAQQYQQHLIDHLPNTECQGERPDSPEMPSARQQAARLWFSLSYTDTTSQLTVTLIRARNIKARDNSSGPRDPYVKVYLLPDEKDCRQSRTVKKTLTPNFNDTFIFKISPEEVTSRSLRMSMYDVDKRRVRHSLGHVIMPLSGMDLTDVTVYTRELEDDSQGNTGLGDLQLALMFTPSEEKLVLTIMQARNLKDSTINGHKDAYVRVQMYHGSKHHKSKKTTTHAQACEPVFNESVCFTVPSRLLESCSLVASIMLPSNQADADLEYGRVVLGSFLYARGAELHHWEDMIAKPRHQVERWHALADPNTTSFIEE